jgi:hypothetical protein
MGNSVGKLAKTQRLWPFPKKQQAASSEAWDRSPGLAALISAQKLEFRQDIIHSVILKRDEGF